VRGLSAMTVSVAAAPHALAALATSPRKDGER
jgi:hypothetical protein